MLFILHCCFKPRAIVVRHILAHYFYAVAAAAIAVLQVMASIITIELALGICSGALISPLQQMAGAYLGLPVGGL